MKEFFSQFSSGDYLAVVTTASKTTINGKLQGIDETFIYLESEGGFVKAVALRAIECVCHIEDVDNKVPAETKAEDVQPEDTLTEEANLNEKEGMPFNDHYETEELPPVNLKIVGKIDLDRVPGRKPRNVFRQDDQRLRLAVDPERYALLSSLWMPASGHIKQIGPKFGFITDKDGKDIYFNINRATLEPIRTGQEVLFSCFDGPVGPQANTIHGVKNVAQMFHFLCRQNPYSGNGQRIISDLAAQIEEAFSENEIVMEELDKLREKMSDAVASRNEIDRNSPKVVLYLCRLAEEWLPDRYEDFIDECVSILEEAKAGDYEEEKRRIYDVYTQLVKHAKGDDREKYVTEAVDYYDDLGEWKKSQYFSRLLDRRQFNNSYSRPYNGYANSYSRPNRYAGYSRGYNNYGYANDGDYGYERPSYAPRLEPEEPSENSASEDFSQTEGIAD